MANPESPTAQFIEDYGSALDPSTILAILSDYDVTDHKELEAVRKIFDSLQLTAGIEEDTGFDASASSGAHNGDDSGSGTSLPGWSSSTDDTELTLGLSPLDIDGSSGNGKNRNDTTYGDQLEGLDQETKESVLVEMFPGMKPFDIRWTLKKDGWDINKAINDLMTQLFMEQSGTRLRGIEAFSESDVPSQVRKGKGTKKKYRAMEDLTSPGTPDSSASSKWDTGKQDVEFIATRTGKSPKEIGWLYHKNGASIRATIIAVLETQVALMVDCKDPLLKGSVIDLGHEFPTLPQHLLQPLIEITHPSTANAHELAKALTFQPTSSKPNIQIEFRHAPIAMDSEPLKPASSNVLSSGLTLDTATGLESRYAEDREAAFTQARHAYRKGKSDPLMGGAAA